MAARKRKPRELDDVEDGEVLRYHFITTSTVSVPVRIEGEPWALANGERVVNAVNLEDGRSIVPWLGALSRPSPPEGKAP